MPRPISFHLPSSAAMPLEPSLTPAPTSGLNTVSDAFW
jgi:hypothetical protein